jgi:hypothetical protein
MAKLSWRDKAKIEGRICPECTRPVPKKYWKPGLKQCYICRYAHRGVSGVGAGGSVRWDNRGTEAAREAAHERGDT